MAYLTKKDGTLKIAVISAGHFCHDIYTAFLAPILPLLIKKFELTYASAGLLSVMLRLPSLFNPLIGAYADRYNLKYFVIISPTITAVSICLIGNAPDFLTILLLTFTAGIGSACFHVPAPVLLNKFAGTRVGAGMSSFMIGGEMARTVGPIIVLFAISVWSLHGLYRLIPAGLFCSAVFYYYFRDVSSSSSIKKAEHHIRGSIITTIRNNLTLFIAIFGILFTKSCTASLISAFLPTYLNSSGKSLWFAGGALSIVEASAVAGVLMSGTISDKIGCKRMLLIITILTPLTMFMFLNSGGYLFFLSLILLGLSAFASTPVLLSLVQRNNFIYPSIANGIYKTSGFIMSALMVLLAGKLSDVFGIEFTFNLFGAMSPAGILFVFLLKDDKEID